MLRLNEIFDVPSLQKLFDAFYNSTGTPAAILSLSGEIIVGSGQQSICKKFHQQHSEPKQLCIQNDIEICERLKNEKGYSIYRCPHGLTDAAIPIFIHDKHIASLFSGPFLFEPPDENVLARFEKRALQWGFNVDAYLEALSAVPVIPEKKLEPLLDYLKQLAEMIGQLGFSLLKLNDTGKKIDAARASLKDEATRRKGEAQKLLQILEGNPIPTFVINDEGKITHWNRACEVLTTIPAEEILGTDNHREAFYDKRRDLLVDLIVRKAGIAELKKLYGEKYTASTLVSEGFQGEDFFPKLGTNGRWLLFTGAPLKSKDGRVVGAIETFQDITTRQYSEQKLRNSEIRYRKLFESANDAIFVMENGLVIDCNRKALDLFQSSKKEMVGLGPLDLSPDTQPLGGASKEEIVKRQKRVRKGLSQVFEWRFTRNNGSWFDAEVNLTQLSIGDQPSALAIVRDITKQKAMVKALEYQKAELDDKRRYLERVNQALKSSLDHREVEKRAVEEALFVNLKRFVFPYVEELEKCKISADGKAYVNIIKTNINDMISRHSGSIYSKYADFTPTEVRVADLIRGGKNTKEIAAFLGLSPSSVKWHRKNIRKKLGLTNKKSNLHTYLNSLEA